MKYSSLFELTVGGMKLFENIMLHGADEHALDLTNKLYAVPVHGTKEFAVEKFETAKQMAKAISESFGELKPQEFAARTGVWCWLYFVMLDVLSPKKKDGKRKVLEFVRWFPAHPNDYQKAQRHLVRMPVILYSALGDDADHLLCGLPSMGPDIREQLTAQQDMFQAGFQKACKSLYFDSANKKLKPGLASQTRGGSVIRMRQVRRQLDVTWDMTDLNADRILQLLPTEFDQFKA
jgi:hypothetical protein